MVYRNKQLSSNIDLIYCTGTNESPPPDPQGVCLFDGRSEIHRRSPEPYLADARLFRRSTTDASESRHLGNSSLLFDNGFPNVSNRLRTFRNVGHRRRTVSGSVRMLLFGFAFPGGHLVIEIHMSIH